MERDLAAPEIFGAGDGATRLDLPPGFEGIVLREGGDAFRYACAIAERRGAGTLVWTQRFDLVEFALVLEPDEPLSSARRVLYAGLSAMADALAVHCPPEKPVQFHWPDRLLFDHGLIGGARLGWPDGIDEAAAPDWLVFGGMMRTAVVRNSASGVSLEPGTWSIGTSLEVEGFEAVDSAALVESFARHLMVHLETWRERGFTKIGREWLSRMPPDPSVRRGIDTNGDLLIRPANGAETPERQDLLVALADCGWFDHTTGEPRL